MLDKIRAKAEETCLRIVYLNPASHLGGAERVLLDVMASVRSTEPSHELHLVVPEDGPLVAQARTLGVGITVLPMPRAMNQFGEWGLERGRLVRNLRTLAPRTIAAGWSSLTYLPRLQRILRRLQPDVIHSNGIKTHILSGLVNTGRAVLIWHVHDFLTIRPGACCLLRWLARPATLGVAVSDAIAGATRMVMPQLAVEVVHNAIDTTAFTPGPGEGMLLDRLAGLPAAPANVVRVGFVATYARWKGHDVFLRAAAQLVRTFEAPLRFYLVGGPIYATRGSQYTEDELRHLAHDLGLDQHVGLIPFQQELTPLYRGLEIIVHASTQPEPFGRTIVEAMACGKPVLVSWAGGAAELFTHQYDAIGVPPNDVKALGAALLALVRSPEQRSFLGGNARQTAVRRFSRERLGGQMLALYQRRNAGRSPAPRSSRAA
jgi:glycosyltransferase involved in cell wall biosynthesis